MLSACSSNRNHHLPSRMHMDVLDRDLLLTLPAVAVERVEQHGVSVRQLVGLGENSRGWPSNVCSPIMARPYIPSKRCGRRRAAQPSFLQARPAGRCQSKRRPAAWRWFLRLAPHRKTQATAPPTV